MNGKQIINELLVILGLTIKELSSNVGVSAQTIYDVHQGKTYNGISKKLAGKIVSVYPFINESFLLTGKGEIINKISKMENTEKIEDALERISIAVLNNSESNKINAEASKINAEAILKSAEASHILSKSLEKILSLLEKNIK